jgi:hypothetical protein
MLKTIEHWKNTLAKLGTRVKRRRLTRKRADLGCSVESLEPRIALSVESTLITGLSVSPEIVPYGSQVTLVATSVSEPGGPVITQVRFHIDADNDGQLTPADGAPLALDTNGSDGWSAVVSSILSSGGNQRYYAVAQNESGIDGEAVSATNTVLLPAKVIDNGGNGYSVVSSNYWSTSGGGYGGGHQFEFGATNGYAEWTFADLPDGEYRVSATWLNGTSHGTNVPYTVFDGSLDVGTIRVNQRVAPAADVVVSSKNFQNLGTFSVVNGSLVVRVTNSAGDGRAIADAVRIQHIGPAQHLSDIRVFSGGTEFADGVSSVNLGTTFFGTPTAATTLTVKNVGLADLVLTPLTQANMPASVTLVSSYGATTLARGESTTFQVQLAATSPGNVSGTMTLPTNDPDEADFQVALTGVVNASKVADNGAVGYSTVSSGYWSTSGGGYGGGHQFEFGANGGYAQWTFPNLPAGSYRISTTWAAASNRGTNVPYAVFDGSFDAGMTTVNQRVAPAGDAVVGSTNFQNLGTFSIVNGSLVVRVTNSSGDGRAIADAVRIEYLGAAQQTSNIRVFTGNTELKDGASSVNLGTTFVGTSTAPTTFTVTNAGLSDLSLIPLTQASMPAGVTLVSSYGSTTIPRGGSTTFQVALSATRTGTVNGNLYLLSDDHNKAAFDIDLSGAVNAFRIVDNGGSGYATVSNSYWSTSGGGYGGGHQFEFGATGGYAEWTIPNLLPGSYRVSTTWLQSTNRGTNVPYTIFDASSNVGTVSVNQRLAPAADVVVGSTNFQDLGTWNVVNGSLVVRVTNSSGDGRAIADAIRLEYLGPLPLDATNVTAGFANGRLDIVGTTANDTIAIGTVDVAGVGYVVVNGNAVGTGVRASDVTQIVADLKAGDDTMDLSTLDMAVYSGLTDGAITIFAGDGNDMLTGSSLGDVIYGEGGDDLILGGASDDHLYGGDGQDSIWGNEGNDTEYGNDGNDELRGNEGNDFLFGGDGQDYLGGATGNDRLHGNAGNDDLHGAVGDDIVYGDAGDDMLYGGTGRDFVYGGYGNDLLLGRHNNDDLIGGFGDDTYRFEKYASTGFDKINELPGEGNDVIDVTTLTLLNTVNTDSSAPQFLTSYLSLQFINEGTVETVLGNTTSSYESTTVDDGDSGFTTASSQTWASSVGGHDNDYQFESGATDGYAEWTFPNLPAGEYWVSATWIEGADRGTNVPYTVFDGSLEVGGASVNQRLTPVAHRVVGTTNFKNLGTYSVVNGSLVVRMDNSSGDGKAIADAVRIERIGSAPQIANIRVFNGGTELIPAESTVNLGTTFVGFRTTATILTVENVGLSDLVLTPLTQAEMPAGVTLVSSYANTVLARGQSTTFQIQLAATSAGVIDDSLLILSNDADEGTFEIAISGTVRGVEIVDDEDSGFVVVSGTWQENAGGFGEDNLVSSLADGAVEWSFTDLVPGSYRVSATWSRAANLSTVAPYTITGGSAGVTSVLVNQQNAPRADATSGGRDFEDLGSFHVFEGDLVVRLASSSAASVSADAIRLEYLGAPVPSDVASFADGQLDVGGHASNDTVAIGTVNVGGVLFVVVNGQMVGGGVRASDVTAITANLGDGDDTIDLSSLDLAAFTGLSDGAVTIHGGAGHDTMKGTPLADVLYGDDGDDEILGHGGNDIIHGGNGSDILVGGDGDDTYVIGSPGDTGTDSIDEAANGGTDRVDLTGLSTLQQISVGSTAVQSVTNGQSMQFVNAGTVESILGRVSRSGGGGILTMPGDPGQDLDAALTFGGYSWVLEESESGSVVVFEVDDDGYPLQSGPGGQIVPLRSFDFDLDPQSVNSQSVETTFPSGTHLAFYFEFDGERFYSIPAMNDGGYYSGEALGFGGSTDFGWSIGGYYNPGYSDLYLNVALVQAVGGITVEANPIRGKEGELSNVAFTFTRYATTDEYGNEDPDAFEEPGVVAWVPLYGELGGELMYSNFTSSVQYGGHLHALIPAGERSVTLTFPMTDADNEYPGPATMIGAGLAGYYPWSGGVPAIDGEYDPYSYAFVTIYDDDTVDLDIDSDNSGTIDYSLDEESLEDNSNEPGKIIAVGGSRAKLEIAHRNDGVLKLTVPLDAADKVRFWTSEIGGSVIQYLPEAEGGQAVLDPAYLLGTGVSQTLWVEAIKRSESAGDIVVTLQGPNGSEDTDTVRLTAVDRVVVTVTGDRNELVYGVPSDVTPDAEEPQETAEIIVTTSQLGMSNGEKLRITSDGGLNIWKNKEKTDPLGYHNENPTDSDGLVIPIELFAGEQRLYVEGNVEGLDRAITIELLNASGEVVSTDRVLFSVEEYIDLRPLEELARLNDEIGAAVSGDALQYLTSAEYAALKAEGLEVGRHDGLWDYVFLEIGSNYYTYIEPTLPGFSYKLFAIAPNSVSIAALKQGAELANWSVGLGAIDVALSVVPGGTSAGYIEEGAYGRAALWFLADVGLTISVVGKLGQVTAKAGSVVRSGSAARIGKFLTSAAQIGQHRHVVLGSSIATGILGAESGVGAVNDVLNGQYAPAAIKGLDAVFAALGVSSSATLYTNALTDAARANKKLADKVDVQKVASQTAHGSLRQAIIPDDDWCFAPATLVSTSTGRRPIGEIEPNDEVYALDFDTGEYVLARVLKRHNNLFSGTFLTINLSNGDKIEVTTNHPIWVVSGDELLDRATPPHDGIRTDEGKSLGGRWLNSQDLQKGDRLHARGGLVIEVTSVERLSVTSQPVCNLTIAGYHNYSVTNAELLAHNDTSWCDLLIEKGWTSAQKEKLLDMANKLGFEPSAVHGHHIVMKGDNRPATVAAQNILLEYGIPLLDTKPALREATDLSNMAMAINGHLGIHSDAYAQAVLDNLTLAAGGSGTWAEKRERVIASLGEMRTTLEDGKSFW